ncbi:MAG TPA: hypothetical protein VHY76_14540 [Acetobacteraceae bacterium]|nr:hypothetical protein [Acetobacteraceae bacterium]
MATYTADVNWTLRKGDDLLSGRYSRGHTVSFDGGKWVGSAPEKEMLEHMHHEAHEGCFIANSVRTVVTVA